MLFSSTVLQLLKIGASVRTFIVILSIYNFALHNYKSNVMFLFHKSVQRNVLFGKLIVVMNFIDTFRHMINVVPLIFRIIVIFISDLDNSAIFYDKISLRLIRVKHTESFCSGEETFTATAAESVQVEEDDGAEDTEDGGG